MSLNTPWTADDYQPFATGSGADKLADSGVAPLVAHARGTRTINPGPHTARSLIAEVGAPARGSVATQIKTVVAERDALFMPWYLASDIVEDDAVDDLPRAATWQLRPHPTTVEYDPTGKLPKYVFPAGGKTIIGSHPAIPRRWFTGMTDHQVMFVEGQLKADSALTGMLRAAGISDDQLAATDPDPAAARNRLRDLMAGIDPRYRLVVFALVSISTFEKNPEWMNIRLSGDTYIAIDGDLGTKVQVWDGARKMFDQVKAKGGIPQLIDMSAETLPDGSKCGADDYLTRIAGWDQWLTLATPVLPDRPDAPTNADASGWRMNGDKRVCEQWRPPVTEDDAGHWVTKYEFAARIKTVEDSREVSDIEKETGEYVERFDAAETTSRIEVEVSWKDGDRIRHGVITGPAELASTTPSEWRRVSGTAIPSQVHLLPDWAPKDTAFNKAMKLWRRDDVVHRPLWSHMGWVPVEDSTPVFVVGSQVVGPDGFCPESAATSVTEVQVRNSSKFGVQLPDDDDDARRALVEVMDAYYPVDENLSPWRNRKHAAIFLAAALRPVVPLDCHVSVALTGHSGSGKSWASGFGVMAFWQAQPGTWHDKSLPGGADDTLAYSEVAVSCTPVWVVDDLAPSESDPTKHGRQAEQVWSLVRRVHNKSSRGRRKADMTAQTVYTPRALLVVSAEQTPEKDQSIMNRLVHVKVRKNRFLCESRDITDHIAAMAAGECPQSKVTGYALKMLARRAALIGWERMLVQLREALADHSKRAAKLLGAEGKRQADTIADLALGLTVLSWMVEDLGLEDECEDRLLDMTQDLYDVARDGYKSAGEIVLGKLFMSELASALSGHRCHVSALGLAGPPVTPSETGFGAQSAAINDLLGWDPATGNNESRPNGPVVGRLVTDKNGELAVLFDPNASFNAVGSGFRTASASGVWESACQNGFQLTEQQGGWKVRTSGGGAGWKQRVTQNGHSLEGVAVSLKMLLGQTKDDDDD